MQGLPCSIEAEINILSSILIDPKKIINTIGKITEDDFYNTANQKIYSAMVRLFSENKPIEPLSIINTIGNIKIILTLLLLIINNGIKPIKLQQKRTND